MTEATITAIENLILKHVAAHPGHAPDIYGEEAAAEAIWEHLKPLLQAPPLDASDATLIQRARQCAGLDGDYGPLTMPYVKILLGALANRLATASGGNVTWHSSGQDEGPDVGLELDLGGGRSLWLGEGQKPAGWQFSVVVGDEIIPVADVIDHDQARALFDDLAQAVRPTLDPSFVAWLEERDMLPDDGRDVEWSDIICALNDREADLCQGNAAAEAGRSIPPVGL